MKGTAAFIASAMLAVVGEAAAWPSVPLPEYSQGEWVSRHMNYNGIDMRASRFVTTRDLDEVKTFYQGLWGDRQVENQIDGKTIIGREEGDHFITVELRAIGGGTEGVIGVMQMPEPAAEPSLGEGFATPAGTEVFNDVRYYDTPRESRVLAMVNAHTPFVNHQFYAHRMRMQGWSMSSDPTGCRSYSGSCVAGFEKGEQRMTLAITRSAQGETQVVATIE